VKQQHGSERTKKRHKEERNSNHYNDPDMQTTAYLAQASSQAGRQFVRTESVHYYCRYLPFPAFDYGRPVSLEK
jgi:hypothetical protein